MTNNKLLPETLELAYTTYLAEFAIKEITEQYDLDICIDLKSRKVMSHHMEQKIKYKQIYVEFNVVIPDEYLENRPGGLGEQGRQFLQNSIRESILQFIKKNSKSNIEITLKSLKLINK